MRDIVKYIIKTHKQYTTKEYNRVGLLGVEILWIYCH